MDVAALAYTCLVGGMAVTVVNAPTLMTPDMRRERYLRSGILRASDAPASDAPDGFVVRQRRSERRALVGSVATTLAIGLLLVLGGSVDVQALTGLLPPAALLGRLGVLAVEGAREALEPGDGPRVSRGVVVPLTERVPVLVWALLPVAQAAFLVSFGVVAAQVRPAWAGFVWATAAVSAVITAAGWAAASWLARQPQRAGDGNELAWSDAARREQISGMLSLGPLSALAVMVAAFADGEGALRAPVGFLPVLGWVYLGVLVALFMAATILGRRRGAGVGENATHADR